eukprot:16806-Heterococcus_DN1.PRE.1
MEPLSPRRIAALCGQATLSERASALNCAINKFIDVDCSNQIAYARPSCLGTGHELALSTNTIATEDSDEIVLDDNSADVDAQSELSYSESSDEDALATIGDGVLMTDEEQSLSPGSPSVMGSSSNDIIVNMAAHRHHSNAMQ